MSEGDSRFPRNRLGLALRVLTRTWAVRAQAVGLVLCSLVTAGPGDAQHCVEMDESPIFRLYPNPNGLNNYRINIDSFNEGLNLTFDEAVAVVGHGAAAWNSHGSTGYFRFIGTTTYEEDESNLCNESEVFNIVTMTQITDRPGETDCDDARAFMTPICQGTRWWLNICLSGPEGDLDWSFSGDPGSGQQDLISIITHEFGHSLNMGHPAPQPSPGPCDLSNGEGAVMCARTAGAPDTRQRDLYPFDVDCLHIAGEDRDLDVIAQPHIDGSFTQVVYVADSGAAGGAYRGHPAVQWDESTPVWSRVLHLGTSPANTDLTSYLGLTGTSTGETDPMGLWSHAVSTVWWPERPGELRAFYQFEHPNPGWSRPWRIKHAVYSDDLSSTLAHRYLLECTNASCSTRTWARSGHRVAHAWNEFTNESVTVWAHQNRDTNSSSREIRVAQDIFGNRTVGLPERTGRQTTVAPAVACKVLQAGEFGSYDCIIAYVSYGTAGGTNSLAMFYVSSGDYFWRSSDVNLLYETYQGLALWYQDNYWWLAFNDFYQRVKVARSTDGVSWSIVDDLGLSYQAPAVDATYTGDENYVFMAR